MSYKITMTQNIDGKFHQKEVLAETETFTEAEAFIAKNYKNFERPNSQVTCYMDANLFSPFRASARIYIREA